MDYCTCGTCEAIRIDKAARAIRDRIAEHGYAMSLDTARDLAEAATGALSASVDNA